jgi:hypothetical protein
MSLLKYIHPNKRPLNPPYMGTNLLNVDKARDIFRTFQSKPHLFSLRM